MEAKEKDLQPSRPLYKRIGKIVFKSLSFIVLSVLVLSVLAVVLLYTPTVQQYAVDKAADYATKEMGMKVKVDTFRLRFPLHLNIKGVKVGSLLTLREINANVEMMPLLDGEIKASDIYLLQANVNTDTIIPAASIKGKVSDLSVNKANFSLSRKQLDIDSVVWKGGKADVVLADSVPEDTTQSDSSALRIIDIKSVVVKNISANVQLNDTTSTSVSLGEASMGVWLDLETPEYRVTNFALANTSGSFNSDISARNVGVRFDKFEMKGTDMKLHNWQAALDATAMGLPETKVILSHSGVFSLDSLNMKAEGSPIKAAVNMPGVIEGNFVVDDLLVESYSSAQPRPYAKARASMTTGNLSPLEKLLPKEAVQYLRQIPKGSRVSVDVDVNNQSYNLKGARIGLGGSVISLRKSEVDLEKEEYDIDVDVSNFLVNRFVPLEDQALISGRVVAKGRGFDFLSPKTYTESTLHLSKAQFGKYVLTNTSLAANLRNTNLEVALTTNDSNLVSSITYDGTLSSRGITGTIGADIRKADLYSLGVVDSALAFSFAADMKVESDFNKLVGADTHFQNINVITGSDCIYVDSVDLYAFSSSEKTELKAVSGDMNIDLNSPLHYENIIGQFTQIGQVVARQAQEMRPNIDEIRPLLPELSLKACIGDQNPLTEYIKFSQVKFDSFTLTFNTSSEEGLRCDADIYGLEKDSLRVDTASLDIYHNDDVLHIDADAKFPQQANAMKAFDASVKMSVAPDNSQIRLFYIDENDDTGIDFGIRAQVADSALHMDVYPYKPIFGYKQFEVSNTNYIDLHRKNRIFADVHMTSLDDSCQVDFKANPNDDERQRISLMLEKLNLEKLLSVVPFIPKMTGVMGGDVTYVQKFDSTLFVGTDIKVNDFVYEKYKLGKVQLRMKYNPGEDSESHELKGILRHNDKDVAEVKGVYESDSIDASLQLKSLPFELVSAFMEDAAINISGSMVGELSVKGLATNPIFNGFFVPVDARVTSDVYSFNLTVGRDTIRIEDSNLNFGQFRIFGVDDNPVTLRGYVDFADLADINMNLNIYGKNVELINARKTSKSALYGKIGGDILIRVIGNTRDLRVTGMVKVLNTSDITYSLMDTPLSVGYRLDDIVTFVDSSAPPDSTEIVERSFMGLDMRVSLMIEDGVKIKCIYSADGKCFVDVQGGGELVLEHTSEGILQLTGRYTVNEGMMTYANTVIPLKTFKLVNGSYIEFVGDPLNPALNIAAYETVRVPVSNEDRSTRTVTFNTGLRLSQTVNQLGLEFTIDAPEDMNVQNELASMAPEEKNKIALTMLATGIYMSSTNETGFSTTNALNSFLQGEINNIAGKALNSVLKMDMNLGMEQTTGQDGASHTDYSFKFTKRLFSDRLNIVLGGLVNTAGNVGNTNHSGTYINDVSLEWRLDQGGTQYARLFHDVDYNNLVEGRLEENGGGIVLRKSVARWADLLQIFNFKKKSTRTTRPSSATTQPATQSATTLPTASPTTSSAEAVPSSVTTINNQSDATSK